MAGLSKHKSRKFQRSFARRTLATAQKRPIYVANALFEQVEDMTEVLDRINENGGENE